MKIPEKYWESQSQQVSLPFACSMWACAEPAEKTNQSQRFFDQVATGLVYTPKATGSELFSHLTFLHTTAFMLLILLNIFRLVETISLKTL